jgi:hypothetical protein
MPYKEGFLKNKYISNKVFILKGFKSDIKDISKISISDYI